MELDGEVAATHPVGVEAERDDDGSQLWHVVALSAEGIISTDEQQRILLFNRAAEEIFGYEAEEVIGQQLAILIPSSVRERHHEMVDRMLAQGTVSRRMGERHVLRGRRRSGEEFDAGISFSTLRLAHGSIATAVVRDLTELRRARDLARQSESRYRTLVDLSPVGIFTCADDGTILDANPALVAMLGAESAAAVRGQSLPARFADPECWDRLRDGRFVGHAHAPLEQRLWRFDTGHVDLMLKFRRAGGVTDAPIIYGFALDVTERRRLEATVSRADHLHSLGKLAGGVAHDFNNLISIIRLCAESMRDDPAIPGESRLDLEDIDRAAVRAGELTQQLLAFGRRQVLHPRPLDLAEVVLRNEGLVRRLLGEDVSLRITTAPEGTDVLADDAQIERVLVNLITNARDAMPTGGNVSITVGRAEPSALERAECLSLPPGPFVRLAVSDSGSGIDPATRARLFEPFFTTKDVANGTGLGLASIYGIVLQSGGGITVASAPGEGTTFSLWFPAISAKVYPTTVALPNGDVPPALRLPLRVLVVEDEDGIRRLVVRALERRGIEVRAAADGPAALALLTGESPPPDVIISDVVLPGLSGQQLVEQVAAQVPDVRTLFISGYSRDAVQKHGRLRPGSVLLPKPFTAEQLMDALARLLAATPASPASAAPTAGAPSGGGHAPTLEVSR
jgi:two-component system, cell cycle sensor histidine kinase and response regulator CckA